MKLEKWKCQDRDGTWFVFVGFNVKPVPAQKGWIMPFYPNGKKVFKMTDIPNPDWHTTLEKLPVYRYEAERFARTGRISV